MGFRAQTFKDQPMAMLSEIFFQISSFSNRPLLHSKGIFDAGHEILLREGVRKRGGMEMPEVRVYRKGGHTTRGVPDLQRQVRVCRCFMLHPRLRRYRF